MSNSTDYLRASARLCNATAVRQASRHLSRFYDKCLADVGLRGTQYTILLLISRRGAASVNDLAEAIVMDRSTLGHNLRPLERDGLIAFKADPDDRRRRLVVLTETGGARLEQGRLAWNQAQAEFERQFGADQSKAMRDIMSAVVATPLD